MTRSLFFLLALATLAEPLRAGESDTAEKLGVWAGLAGGQWHAKGKWTNGGHFEARMVAEWGFAKRILRLRVFIPRPEGEYLRYDSLYFWHPGHKKPTYFSSSYNGQASAGQFEVDKKTVTFLFPSGARGAGDIKSVYGFVDKDRVRWQVFQQKGEDWTGLLDVTYVRGEKRALRRLRTKALPAIDLKPLLSLVGKWDVKGDWADGRKMDGQIEFSEGRTKQVLTWTKSVRKKDKLEPVFMGVLWWDRAQKRIRSFEFSTFGWFNDGEVRFEDDVVVAEWKNWAGETTSKFRQTMRFTDADRHEWDLEQNAGEGWKVLAKGMQNTRVKAK